MSDVAVATLKAVEEVRDGVRSLQEDVAKVKVALVKHLPEEDRETIFSLKVHEDVDEFEAFCQKLEEPNFKRLVVSKHFPFTDVKL